MSGREEVFVCDKCKQEVVSTPRRPSIDLVTDLFNHPPNAMEVLNHLPFMVTLYTTEGRAVLRNDAASELFHKLPNTPAFQNQLFLPHVAERV
jgi:hypothetical protein